MKEIELKGFVVRQMSFENNLPNGTKIELNNKYSYNVGHSGNNVSRGEFKAEITDKKNPDKFNITVVVVGVFSSAPDVTREKAHVESYKEIFPYVRSLVTTITANAGIPPIIIPAVDIEAQSIYRVDMPRHNPDNDNNNEEFHPDDSGSYGGN